MPVEMCLLCGQMMQPDGPRPGCYRCVCCGNRTSPSRPQISEGFILAVGAVATLAALVLLIWYLWGWR
jgi:hypothetical protein